MLTERRRDVRVPVDFLLNKLIRGIPYTCRVSNISRGGMLVHRISEPLGLLDEDQVALEFMVPGDDRLITCDGALVHEHDWLMANGIRFTRIDPRDRRIIERFVSERVEQLTS
jgi:c-di-GMP-binding flagellar brake protein YcgR